LDISPQAIVHADLMLSTTQIPLLPDIVIPKVFEGTSDYSGSTWDGWFALNVGNYDVTDIYSASEDWGYSLSAPANSEFTILQNLTKHIVYQTIMLESNFSAILDDNGTDIYGLIADVNNLKISNMSNGYNWSQGLFELLDQQFMPLVVFDWNPAMLGNTNAYFNDGRHALACALNLSEYYWD